MFHDIATNGIGAYVNLIFDMSGIEEELLPIYRNFAAVLGVIDTENYEYGELFNEINAQTGGIGTSLELYTDVNKSKRKRVPADISKCVQYALYYQFCSVAFA